jgi:hypothetical protein
MQNTNELSVTFSRAGLWFWMAIVLGAAIRFYLVVFTEGTFDAQLREGHSRDVIERGVVGCYHVKVFAGLKWLPSTRSGTFLEENVKKKVNAL